MTLTLSEAITHCEEVAEQNEKESKLWKGGVTEAFKQKEQKLCECAKDHRQLAEWLKELKKLREIPDKLVPKYRDDIQDEYNRGANEMLEEVIDDIRKYIEEVNADEQ